MARKSRCGGDNSSQTRPLFPQLPERPATLSHGMATREMKEERLLDVIGILGFINDPMPQDVLRFANLILDVQVLQGFPGGLLQLPILRFGGLAKRGHDLRTFCCLAAKHAQCLCCHEASILS
jgi:hypothetical protein